MKTKGSSNEKTTVNLLKNDANFQQEKTRQKIASKLDLGGSWAPFGRGLGRSGGSFAHSWALLGRLPWKPPLFNPEIRKSAKREEKKRERCVRSECCCGKRTLNSKIQAQTRKRPERHSKIDAKTRKSLPFGRLGMPRGLILGLLGLAWGLLGSLFGPSWPKLAHDNEKKSICSI